MSSAGFNVGHMSKMIQIRNVPDGMHRDLKLRAAAAGMSLSDYIKQELMRTTRKHTMAEIDARIKARGRSKVKTENIVQTLRESRGV
jgi:antitoxin FitA